MGTEKNIDSFRQIFQPKTPSALLLIPQKVLIKYHILHQITITLTPLKRPHQRQNNYLILLVFELSKYMNKSIKITYP